jgi:hypothetical protein
MLTEARRIDILGSAWRVQFREQKQDKTLEECDGYCDASENLIVVKIPEEDAMSLGNLENYQKKVLRHEIFHAFLFESGMGHCSSPVDCWATNEEMVDWFAIQSPKIFRVFQEQGLI